MHKTQCRLYTIQIYRIYTTFGVNKAGKIGLGRHTKKEKPNKT